MSRNEKTSPRVAKIAAKVMAMSRADYEDWMLNGTGWRDIRALAASALTQARPKGKIQKRKAVR